MHDKLHLYEEILLLALRDEEGTIASGTMYQYAIGGSVLAELLLSERITVEEKHKRKVIRIENDTPLGDALLDECLGKVRGVKKPQAIETWVSKFASIKDLKHKAATQLCRRGILRVSEDKVLHIFTRKIYPEVDPGPEQELIEKMRAAIFSEIQDIDPEIVVLVSLAHSAGLLKIVFDKKELKGRKKRIEEISNGEITGKATQDAIQAMQAAIMVASIMPAIIATTVTTST